MSRYSLISLIILYLCFDNAYQHNVKNKKHGNNTDWDVLIFTQSWPETVCKIWTHKNKKHSCVFPKQNDSWTIHGIWPTKLGTRGPENCNETWHFDPEQVKSIENELEQAWTNVEKETPLYSFWAHEWTKHGTCAAQLKELNNELNYFSKGLEFLKKYHMTDALKAANIFPSDTKQYKIEDINQAVVARFGQNPHIECVSENGVQYLQELRICFNKQLKLTTCAGTTLTEDIQNGILTNCNVKKPIVFPSESQPPHRILVQLHKFINWLQWFTL